MPSPTTALQIIEDALGLCNCVGVDQTPTADEVSDSLRAFNDLLEDWSTQNLAVWGNANQTFPTVAGQATYTIGPAGNWNTTRPANISDPAYSTIQGVTFPCISITQDAYNRIAVKAQPQQYPNFYLYVNDYPLGLVTLWPVPNAVTPITFSIDRLLTQITSAAAAITFPPGYAKAFKYCLGVELAPLFGKKIANYPDVVAIYKETFGNVKRSNNKQRTMTFDPAYGDSTYGAPDWFRGW